jgi:hypothetical protein
MYKVVPIHPGYFLSGSKSVREIRCVAEEVKDLLNIIVLEEVMGRGH